MSKQEQNQEKASVSESDPVPSAETPAPPVKHIVISGGNKPIPQHHLQTRQRELTDHRTGAQGIGRCLARTFLQKGHKVFILDINEPEMKYTAETHLAIYTERKTLAYALCDLRDLEAIRNTAKTAAAFFDNRIDVLVNNGGISNPFWKDKASMDDFETAIQWQAYVDTNLSAPFYMSQALLPYMKVSKDREERKRQRQGPSPCIIHVSSFRMLQSDPNQEGYASSKSGLIGLTHSMAVSLSEYGIRVNLVAPGRIRVAHECRKGDEQGKQWGIEEDDAEKFAANRGGMPEDIAECVEWLIGAGFTTGQSITVDGGATMQKR